MVSSEKKEKYRKDLRRHTHNSSAVIPSLFSRISRIESSSIFSKLSQMSDYKREKNVLVIRRCVAGEEVAINTDVLGCKTWSKVGLARDK